jgi:hypothetical protein
MDNNPMPERGRSKKKTCDPMVRLRGLSRGARGPVIVQSWCAALPSANVWAVDSAGRWSPRQAR